jgi:hypothetical protein
VIFVVVYIAVSDATLERLDDILYKYYKMNAFSSGYNDKTVPKNYNDVIKLLLDEFIL